MFSLMGRPNKKITEVVTITYQIPLKQMFIVSNKTDTCMRLIGFT